MHVHRFWSRTDHVGTKELAPHTFQGCKLSSTLCGSGKQLTLGHTVHRGQAIFPACERSPSWCPMASAPPATQFQLLLKPIAALQMPSGDENDVFLMLKADRHPPFIQQATGSLHLQSKQAGAYFFARVRTRPWQ